jgi:hypothetical protein
MRDMEEEARNFWKDKEAEKGGKVNFYTFATFLGRSADRQVTNGGLIYTIDDRVYFEDFEKESWLIKLISKKQKYEKTEFSFDISDINRSKIISRNSALNCIAGYVDSENTRILSPLMKLFSKPVVQIVMKNGTSMFFDIMRAGDFINTLNKLQKSS